MMLRLNIKQLTAHFRIGLVGGACISYPLPPPSTIYGFLRAVTGDKKIGWENTFLSIQGIYETTFMDLQQMLVYSITGNWKLDVIKVQELYNCFWVIHIKSSEEIERKIKEGIENSSVTLRLGRKEDFITDIDVKDDIELKNFGYDEFLSYFESEVEEFEPEDDRQGTRNFERRKLLYIYSLWKENEEYERGFLYRVILDRKRDEEGNIIDDIWGNVIYRRIDEAYDFSDCLFDGEYVVEWLR